MSTDLHNFSLADLLPYNIASDRNISALSQAISPQLNHISERINNTIIFPNIAILPENLTDLLAEQLHADFYELAATSSQKHNAVLGSLTWHMHKGTSWAIIEALRQIGIDAEFLHWHDTGDPPYTFRIKAHVTGDFYRFAGRDKILEHIYAAVNASKAARSVMLDLETILAFTENVTLFTGIFESLSGYEILKTSIVTPPEISHIYAAIPMARQIQFTVNLDSIKRIHSVWYYAVLAQSQTFCQIGLDHDTMYELLQTMEQRLSHHIDESNEALLKLIMLRLDDINLRIDNIEKYLTWNAKHEGV